MGVRCVGSGMGYTLLVATSERPGAPKSASDLPINPAVSSAGFSLHIEPKRLWLTFYGTLSANDGAVSAEQVSACLLHSPRELVLDVRKMKGYDSKARQAWTAVLGPQQKQITRILVVGGSALIRLGASTIAMLLKTRLAFYDDIESLPPPI